MQIAVFILTEAWAPKVGRLTEYSTGSTQATLYPLTDVLELCLYAFLDLRTLLMGKKNGKNGIFVF